METGVGKKRRVVVIALCVLGLLGAVWIGVGLYFVNFALVRPDPGKSAARFNNEEGGFGEYGDISAEGREWLDSVETDTVTLESFDGLTLSAERYVQGDGSRWVILNHGYTGSHGEMATFAMRYAGWGFSALMPDMRAHGESEGKYIGMGWLDRLDVGLWIDFILWEYPDAEIVLHGHSMGGATTLMTTGETLPANVKAAVSDCAYTGVVPEFTHTLREWFSLPGFPIIPMADSMLRLVGGGYSVYDADALEAVSRSATPTLFIHGSEDEFVPTAMVYELYDAAGCEKELLLVDGAGHGCSQFVDPELYFTTVYEFLSKYVEMEA